MFKKPLWQTVDPDQTASIGAVCSGSTLFASILRFVSNVRQLFAADNIFRCIFFGALRVKVSLDLALIELWLFDTLV